MAKSLLRYIVVSDTETSGLPSKEKEVYKDILLIELAAVVIDIWEMKIVEEFDALIKPYNDTYVWEAGAENTHHISQKTLQENGKDVKDVYRAFKDILVRYKNSRIGAVLCGHNFQGFDVPFIEAMFQDQKDSIYNYVRWIEDTQKMAYYRAIEQENFKLGTCCQKEGVELVDAHRALTDTRANAQLMLKYISIMRGEGGSSQKIGGMKPSRFREKFELV